MSKWTLLVYMAADTPYLNTPTEAILDDMTEANVPEDVDGVPADVVVIVQRVQDTGTERFRIHHHKREKLASFGVVDTGNPAYLTEFLKWGQERYPADHYAAVIFGHGNGINDTVTIPAAFKLPHGDDDGDDGAVATTQTFLDYLTTLELRQAFLDTQVSFDIIGLDACQMGMVEVAYELRDAGGFVVSSQPYVVAVRWPYRETIDALLDDPTMSPPALCDQILSEFVTKAATDNTKQTLAAIAQAKLGPLAVGFGPLAQKLTARVGTPAGAEQIRQVRNQTINFGGGYLDMGDLLTRLQAIDIDTGDLLAALSNAVRGVEVTPGAAASGLSVFFPLPGESSDDERASYDQLDFSQVSGWGSFLTAWLAAPSP